MHSLSKVAGSWTGSNAFRLMPADSPHVAEATADVSTAAAGNLTTIAYTWSHPEDGPQDGLLVIGSSEEPDGAVAFWGDSWHQTPQPTVLAGVLRDGVVVVTYAYGGDWHWQITVDGTVADALTLRMENVVPASAATEEFAGGAYEAMVTELRRRA